MDINNIFFEINRSANRAVKQGNADRTLISALFDSCCRNFEVECKNRKIEFGSFAELAESSKGGEAEAAVRASKILYEFYQNRYKEAHKRSGVGSHGSRTITPEDVMNYEGSSYDFSSLYSNSKFYTVFENPRDLKNDTSFMDFILHCSVAFLVSPETLEELLRHYGFAQLHVKNIHHMAIYTVLHEARKMSKEDKNAFDPFAAVEDLYIRSCEIINSSSAEPAAAADEYRIMAASTRSVREYMLQRDINSEIMLNYIRKNKDLFNMRHSLILKDFTKYSKLYTHIYYNYGNRSPEGDPWPEDESRYSLFNFVRTFGTLKGTRKEQDFNEAIGDVQNRFRSPSREFMILIWLYNYCFLSMPSIDVPQNVMSNLAAKYKSANMDDLSEKVTDPGMYHNYTFDICRFIFGKSTEAYEFKGADIKNSINDRLNLYGWGRLSSRRRFDFYIQLLDRISVRMDYRKIIVTLTPDGSPAFADPIRLELDSLPNVPPVLAAVTEIFRRLKAATEDAEPNKPYFPLECFLTTEV